MYRTAPQTIGSVQYNLAIHSCNRTLFRTIRFFSFRLSLVVPHDYVISFFVDIFYRKPAHVLNLHHTPLRISYHCVISHWLPHPRYMAKVSRVWRVKYFMLGLQYPQTLLFVYLILLGPDLITKSEFHIKSKILF